MTAAIGSPHLDDDDAATAAIDVRLDRFFATHRRWAELLALPHREALARVRREPAAQEPYFANLLLITSRVLPQGDDLDAALERVRIGELALAVAERLTPPPGAPLHPLAARALALCGRLSTALGAERRAAQRFGRLAAALGAGGPADAQAELSHGLAQLRWRQGRLPEAIALYTTAAETWAIQGRIQPAALACAQLGFVHLDEGPTRAAAEAARLPLRLAHATLAPRVPALRARVALALALCEAALGAPRRVAKLRQQAAELAAQAGSRETTRAARLARQTATATTAATATAPPTAAAESLALRWLAARIAAAAGRPADAEHQLGEVRRVLLARGSVAEAVSASLDVADARLALGAPDTLAALGHDLLRALGHQVAGFTAARFALLARRACARPPDAAALATARQRLRAALWPLRRHERWRPPLLRTLPGLAEELLAHDEAGQPTLR